MWEASWAPLLCCSSKLSSVLEILVLITIDRTSLLFTGLLINRETVTPALRWLHTISFFHAAFEALAVNELRYLQLKEIKVGPIVALPPDGDSDRAYVVWCRAGRTRCDYLVHLRTARTGMLFLTEYENRAEDNIDE